MVACGTDDAGGGDHVLPQVPEIGTGDGRTIAPLRGGSDDVTDGSLRFSHRCHWFGADEEVRVHGAVDKGRGQHQRRQRLREGGLVGAQVRVESGVDGIDAHVNLRSTRRLLHRSVILRRLGAHVNLRLRHWGGPGLAAQEATTRALHTSEMKSEARISCNPTRAH